MDLFVRPFQELKQWQAQAAALADGAAPSSVLLAPHEQQQQQQQQQQAGAAQPSLGAGAAAGVGAAVRGGAWWQTQAPVCMALVLYKDNVPAAR